MTKQEQIYAIKNDPSFYMEIGSKVIGTNTTQYSYLAEDRNGQIVENHLKLVTKDEGNINEECIILKQQTIPKRFKDLLNMFITYSGLNIDTTENTGRVIGVTYNATLKQFEEKEYLIAKIDNVMIIAPLIREENGLV